jgi:hypothetical protein
MTERAAYAGPRPRDRHEGRRGPAVSAAERPTRALQLNQGPLGGPALRVPRMSNPTLRIVPAAIFLMVACGPTEFPSQLSCPYAWDYDDAVAERNRDLAVTSDQIEQAFATAVAAASARCGPFPGASIWLDGDVWRLGLCSNARPTKRLVTWTVSFASGTVTPGQCPWVNRLERIPPPERMIAALREVNRHRPRDLRQEGWIVAYDDGKWIVDSMLVYLTEGGNARYVLDDPSLEPLEAMQFQ